MFCVVLFEGFTLQCEIYDARVIHILVIDFEGNLLLATGIIILPFLSRIGNVGFWTRLGEKKKNSRYRVA